MERFAAVDGSLLAVNPMPALSKSAAACFLSHRAVWEKAARGDDSHVLIAEDDALLSSDLAAFLSDLSWLPNDTDIVHIGGIDPHCDVRGFGKAALGRTLYRSIWCTGAEAYIISRSCAARLVEELASIEIEFDQIVFAGGRPDLKIYKLLPALAVQERSGFRSLISREMERPNLEKPKLTGLRKWKRESVRLLRQLRRLTQMKRHLRVVYK